MSQESILLTLACSSTAHLVITCVLAVYARHKVQYLCLAWINGLFGFILLLSTFFSHFIASAQPVVILHPGMLTALVAGCYLQSIYPLSIPMPGFLQWGRMWKYATPAIILILLFIAAFLIGGSPMPIRSINDITQHFISFDIPLRLAALCLSLYYIVNIFRLPKLMTHKPNVPRYLLGYTTALGLSVLFYLLVAIFYSPAMLMAYIIIFTALNLYLAFRTLETMAINLPMPVIEEIKEEPSPEEVTKAEKDDFNEANLRRFNRIQYWMQNNSKEWKESTFGRDNLCEATGYNRHLILQSIRSQGYNNIHDYINTYRIAELKRLISRGEVTCISETLDAGFGTTKTARSCFLKIEGTSLDDYLAAHS